jgi:hypothetical protein
MFPSMEAKSQTIAGRVLHGKRKTCRPLIERRRLFVVRAIVIATMLNMTFVRTPSYCRIA